MTYRFLGSYAEVGNVRVERFGERVEMSQSDAEVAICSHAALLPDAEFAKLSFTDAELSEFYAVGLHSLAPAEFLAKRDAAWSALRAFCAQLQNAAVAAKE